MQQFDIGIEPNCLGGMRLTGNFHRMRQLGLACAGATNVLDFVSVGRLPGYQRSWSLSEQLNSAVVHAASS
jgi:hypothetical protein